MIHTKKIIVESLLQKWLKDEISDLMFIKLVIECLL